MKTQGKFRKKPVVIDAMLYNGHNFFQLAGWIRELGGDPSVINQLSDRSNVIYIQTLENTVEAYPGWYIIRGVKGEFYSCEPEVFELTYEEAEDDHTNNC